MGSKRSSGSFSRYSKDSFMERHFSFSPDKSPKLSYALVVIFLEFFSWGLLTMPLISVLSQTFPTQTFLHNGIIMGIKGILSFLSAPMIGGMSDLWGRKPFLVITVFFTCLPIPFISLNPYIYFTLVAFSGLFSVTFSVVFAYVSDITDEQNRTWAYGAVSATFAFSLVISPAAGSYLSWVYGDNWVVVIATLISLLDVVFIVICIPESLPEKLRLKSKSIWETADPFSALKQAGNDPLILRLVLAVLLSYLPEAGQYSCFFIYLKLVIGFSAYEVALFIALVGLMSIFAQTVFLSYLIRKFGAKNAITIGLIFEMLQLICYGLGSDLWIIWGAAVIASASSITYPAISAYVSNYADDDKQGLVQGMITGVRGLCTGIGPAMFGVVFFCFGVDLNNEQPQPVPLPLDGNSTKLGEQIRNFINGTLHFHHKPFGANDQLIPGPPFLVGAVLVLCAILVMALIPEVIQYHSSEYPKAAAKLSLSRASLASPGGSGQASRNASMNHHHDENYYYKSVTHLSDSDPNHSQNESGSLGVSGMKMLTPQLLGVSSESHRVDIEEMNGNGDDESILYMVQPSMSCTLSETESSDSDENCVAVRQRSMSQHYHDKQETQQVHHRSYEVLSPKTDTANPSGKLLRSTSWKHKAVSSTGSTPQKRNNNNGSEKNADSDKCSSGKTEVLSHSDLNISLHSPVSDRNSHSNFHSSHQHLFNPSSLRPVGT